MLKLGLTALHNNRSILNHQLCNTLEIDAGKQLIPDATIAEINLCKSVKSVGPFYEFFLVVAVTNLILSTNSIVAFVTSYIFCGTGEMM